MQIAYTWTKMAENNRNKICYYSCNQCCIIVVFIVIIIVVFFLSIKCIIIIIRMMILNTDESQNSFFFLHINILSTLHLFFYHITPQIKSIIYFLSISFEMITLKKCLRMIFFTIVHINICQLNFYFLSISHSSIDRVSWKKL